MASSALISLKQTLGRVAHPNRHIRYLKDMVIYLQDFLEDDLEKGSLRGSDLEVQLYSAVDEAVDIIEAQSSKQVVPKSRIFLRKISFFYCVPDETLNPQERLLRIIDEFEFIVESVSEIRNGEGVDHRQSTRNDNITAGPSRIVSSRNIPMAECNENLLRIKDRLTGSSSKLDIISIVGMCGIGKTTLARNLYGDSLICYYFDTRAWVTVSDDYYSQQILRDLRNSINLARGESCNEVSMDQAAEDLYKSLKGRRYLIVMDDVWDTKFWDDIRRVFPDDNNGSRIILTTRLSEVAIYANSFSSIHHMSPLTLEESWNLLRATVFGEKSCPSELEKIGKDIAKNCKGLPLAVAVIGGLLSKGMRTQYYWEYIARNVKSLVIGNDDRLMGILSLSYSYLPYHLKLCFLYVGVFPEDQEIFVSQLVMLWLAEGFLKPASSKSLEEVAEEYLNDLVDRNLILARQRNHHGQIKTCSIHDLLRDLCVKKAEEENFLLVIGRHARLLSEGRKSSHRLSIHRSHLGSNFISDNINSIRSLLYFEPNYSSQRKLYFLGRLRLLKVLDALSVVFREVPSEIFRLVNLRYLAFIYKGRGTLPATISNLQNLQTLIFFSAKSSYLPSEIWKLPQLRHLLLNVDFLPYHSRLPHNPTNSFGLQYLSTLSIVKDFSCTKEVIQILRNLKKLGLHYSSEDHTKFNDLVHAENLESLKCFLFYNADPSQVSFVFPLKLRKLTLSGCRMSWDKMTIVGSLPNLEVLKLKDNACKGPVWDPNDREFIQLKFLLLDRIDLIHWNANKTHFPQLQHLSLSCCYNLEEIPYEIGDIPTLQMLDLYECSASAVESAKLIQEEQQSLGNDELQVRVLSLDDIFSQSERKKSFRQVALDAHRQNYL